MWVPKAEEQVHEEVAERRGGIECAGGGGGLPGRALRGLCSPAEGRDAGSLDGSPSSHKVTERLQTRSVWPFLCPEKCPEKKKCSCVFVVQGMLLCLQIFIHLAWAQRQGQVLP